MSKIWTYNKYVQHVCKVSIFLDAHNTHDHKYDVCKSNQICLYIDLKYVNCDKKHHAKDSLCELYFTLKSNARNIDELHV